MGEYAHYLGLVTQYGSRTKAAAAIGVPSTTFKERYRREMDEADQSDDVEYEHPTLVSEAIGVEDLIEARKAAYVRAAEAKAARLWMRFNVKIDGPFGLAFVGDPHMDDPHCNWPALDRDVKLIRDTPALYGVGGGDYTNAWAGRLQRLYADQSVTRAQSWQLAQWFFGQKKKNGQSIWWALIKGNHDMWNGSADPLDWMERGAAPLEDWRIRFRAITPGGLEVPFDIAHNHKGSSIWNPLHGPMREAQLASQARVYLSNHLHNWGCFESEHDKVPGYVYWACRARGYKRFDSHAEVGGFGDQEYGASIVAIVDPARTGPQMVRCFPDIEEAVDFLKFKRRKM